MTNTIKYGSEQARMQVSHVTEHELVVQVRLPIDNKHDRLDWISIPLAQVPGLETELRAAAGGSK